MSGHRIPGGEREVTHEKIADGQVAPGLTVNRILPELFNSVACAGQPDTVTFFAHPLTKLPRTVYGVLGASV